MENELLIIPSENIQLEFIVDGQLYALLSQVKDVMEYDDLFFAKIDELEDGTKLFRNIESDEEYEMILGEYNRVLEEIGDEEDEN